MARFRAVSIERVRRELPNVEIVNIPGTHVDFPFTSREQVVAAMRSSAGNEFPVRASAAQIESHALQTSLQAFHSRELACFLTQMEVLVTAADRGRMTGHSETP